MKKLAYNAKAALFKVGYEYWYVTADLKHGCFNSQEDDYNASNALSSFELSFGPVDPATKHKDFDRL